MKPPNKGKRAIQKRVVSLPIGELNKGEGTPPKDSWSWRKYGQKPIKGSPYPRGYYRCSSSKGCPARKQVERSKANPSTLMITYAYEHNHTLPLPATSKYSNSPATSPSNEEMAADTTTNTSDLVDDTTNKLEQEETEVYKTHQNLATDESILMSMDYFGWFSDVVSTSERILESPISAGISIGTNSINKEKAGLGKLAFPSMREEDELLFADLGELPECSVVYQGGLYEREEEQGQCSLRAAS